MKDFVPAKESCLYMKQLQLVKTSSTVFFVHLIRFYKYSALPWVFIFSILTVKVSITTKQSMQQLPTMPLLLFFSILSLAVNAMSAVGDATNPALVFSQIAPSTNLAWHPCLGKFECAVLDVRLNSCSIITFWGDLTNQYL